MRPAEEEEAFENKSDQFITTCSPTCRTAASPDADLFLDGRKSEILFLLLA